MKNLYLLLIALAFLLPNATYAAIARDATSRSGNAVAAAPVTWSHTITGSDTYLVVMVGDETSDGVSSVTYNGASMTQLVKKNVAGGIFIYFYGLAAPTSGSNSVTINAGSDNVYGYAVSYTGVKQTGQPDAFTSSGSGAANPFTTTLTTVADNSWTILGQRSAAQGTASTGSTFLQAFNGTDGHDRGLYDSNGPKTPAGSKSMTISYDGSNVLATVMISLSPSIPGPPRAPSILGMVRSMWLW